MPLPLHTLLYISNKLSIFRHKAIFKNSCAEVSFYEIDAKKLFKAHSTLLTPMATDAELQEVLRTAYMRQKESKAMLMKKKIIQAIVKQGLQSITSSRLNYLFSQKSVVRQLAKIEDELRATGIPFTDDESHPAKYHS